MRYVWESEGSHRRKYHLVDWSEFGWSSVKVYLSDDLASNFEEVKRIFLYERRAERRSKQAAYNCRKARVSSFPKEIKSTRPIKPSSSSRFSGHVSLVRSSQASHGIGLILAIGFEYIFELFLLKISLAACTRCCAFLFYSTRPLPGQFCFFVCFCFFTLLVLVARGIFIILHVRVFNRGPGRVDYTFRFLFKRLTARR